MLLLLSNLLEQGDSPVLGSIYGDADSLLKHRHSLDHAAAGVLGAMTGFVKYQSTSVEQMEEAKSAKLELQIAKGHGVTSPQKDFVQFASPARAVAVRNRRNSPT